MESNVRSEPWIELKKYIKFLAGNPQSRKTQRCNWGTNLFIPNLSFHSPCLPIYRTNHQNPALQPLGVLSSSTTHLTFEGGM